MECNRDEALRAKEIAERKFSARDIKAAKKFALKAQTLYPALDGISQMLATFDMYLSAENKINGETDWYAILAIHASADDETVKKQYRKLALILHPDKNKTIGADGAFKLLSEAWSILSDKGRRSQYDHKIIARGIKRKSSQQNRDTSAPTSNGFYNFTNVSCNSRTQNAGSVHAAPPRPPPPSSQSVSVQRPPPRQAKQKSFWTACNRCKMQYEYLRVYLNHNLLCPSCHEPFLAVEIAHPTNESRDAVPWAASHQQNSHHGLSSKTSLATGKHSSSTGLNGRNPGYAPEAGLESFNNTTFQWGACSRSDGAASAKASSSASHTASIVHESREKVSREREGAQAQIQSNLSKTAFSESSEGQSVSGPNNVINIPKVDKSLKRRKGFDDNGAAECRPLDAEQNMGPNRSVIDTDMVNGFSRVTARYGLSRELTSNDLRAMLLDKSKKALQKRISELHSGKERSEGKEPKEKPNKKEISGANLDPHDSQKSDRLVDESKGHNFLKKDTAIDENTGSDPEAVENGSITYPDPDFHDFDTDRSKQCFGPNQVWAAYDDDDGMPRFYAMIQNVVSRKPFKMRFGWLNSKTNSEFGPLNWVGSGFAKTCGEFRVGRYEICDSVSIFSHRVSWEKGTRGAVKVFPKKGDVWAVYRNWAPEWNENTAEEIVHKYDMVEILEDFNEDGVLVTPLVKIAGFRTVFHRHMDPKETKRIPKEEMFRFSHQVPTWLLTGEEGPSAPKGCRELDPASTPLELLQVITETKDDVEVAATDKQVPVS